MKFKVSLFLLLCFIEFVFNGSNYENIYDISDCNEKYYSYKEPLTGSDFLLLPPIDSKWTAKSNCSIECKTKLCSQNDSIELVISSIFCRNYSWIKNQSDSSVLHHEQGHFDITELYSRYLKKNLYGMLMTKNNYKSLIDSIYNQNFDDLEFYQDQYDLFTSNGVNNEEQKKWDIMIDTALLNNQNFDLDTVKIVLN